MYQEYSQIDQIPIFPKLLGLTCSCTMKCFATLENVGVRDIGLESVVKSSIFAFLGNATTFAYLHILGRDPSAIDELIIILTGRASSYEYSRIIQLGILSGPPVFFLCLYRSKKYSRFFWQNIWHLRARCVNFVWLVKWVKALLRLKKSLIHVIGKG